MTGRIRPGGPPRLQSTQREKFNVVFWPNSVACAPSGARRRPFVSSCRCGKYCVAQSSHPPLPSATSWLIPSLRCVASHLCGLCDLCGKPSFHRRNFVSLCRCGKPVVAQSLRSYAALRLTPSSSSRRISVITVTCGSRWPICHSAVNACGITSW